MIPFDQQKIIVGVSGGIAAYKTCELVSRLAQAGADVRVVMTTNATEFVGPTTFQALSGNPVYTTTFARPEAYGMGHLSLARETAALVVAPATANLLAKAACGLADDLLSTTLVSVTCPILLAPAMNQAMWGNPIVQGNVALLRQAGYQFVGPDDGWLACREAGAGRMAEPAAILDALRLTLWTERDLTGRRVVITAGPTREHLDPVRFLTNPSTGKQGFALAEAAALRGADVLLVAGPTHLPDPAGVDVVRVTSAEEMTDIVDDWWDDRADLFIGAAAVADFTFAEEPAETKLPKSEVGMSLELTATTDIIAAVAGRRQPHQVVVGFAAETHDVVAHAQAKLARKGLQMIVANDVTAAHAGFAVDGNQVTIITADAIEPLPAMSKLETAHEVLRRAAALLPPVDQ